MTSRGGRLGFAAAQYADHCPPGLLSSADQIIGWGEDPLELGLASRCEGLDSLRIAP